MVQTTIISKVCCYISFLSVLFDSTLAALQTILCTTSIVIFKTYIQHCAPSLTCFSGFPVKPEFSFLARGYKALPDVALAASSASFPSLACSNTPLQPCWPSVSLNMQHSFWSQSLGTCSSLTTVCSPYFSCYLSCRSRQCLIIHLCIFPKAHHTFHNLMPCSSFSYILENCLILILFLGNQYSSFKSHLEKQNHLKEDT